jgi:hypothetical protein
MADSYLDVINAQTELSFVPPQNFYMAVEKLPSTSFMLQRIQIPVLSGDEIVQSTPMNPGRTMIPGNSLEYSVLSADFILDKHFKNYKEVLTWFKNNYAPDDKALQAVDWADQTSNITVIGTDSANVPVCHWNFVDCFPISMDGPMFDATMPDVEYLTSNVTFRFKYFTFDTYTEGAQDFNTI